MVNKTSEILDSIKSALSEEPLSINELSKKLGNNWRTVDHNLDVLKTLGLVKEIEIKNTRTFILKDRNNYFDLPIKLQDKKKISTIYALIRKFCLEKYHKEPTKTHVYKILWRLKKETDLNLPIGWYLHGPCAIQIYQGNEEELTKLDDKIIDLIKKATEEYCEYDNITLQKKIYGEESNELYQLKEMIIDAGEGQEILLLELIKKVPKEAVDVTSDFARITLTLKWEKTEPLFEKLWKYISLIILKNTLKDYYKEDIELYLKDKIDLALKDIQLLLDDVMRTYMDAKYAQDELYQKWMKGKR